MIAPASFPHSRAGKYWEERMAAAQGCLPQAAVGGIHNKSADAMTGPARFDSSFDVLASNFNVDASVGAKEVHFPDRHRARHGINAPPWPISGRCAEPSTRRRCASASLSQ